MKKLTAFQVAVSLATTHYGLGFLIGTGQDIAEYGAAGMLYAFSTAIGLLTLIPITRFYLSQKDPIWDIFEKMHGRAAGELTAFLSSFWMIGVIASQILGGSAALMAFGVPRVPATLIISLLLVALSYIDLGKLSKIFFYFLLTSSAIVLLTLFQYGVGSVFSTPFLFAASIPTLPLHKLLGVFLTTTLITFIGMDFHQFIVAAEDEKAAKTGALGGFLILSVLTTILGGAILGFLQQNAALSNSSLVTAQVVPHMLMNTGSQILGSWGRFLFLLPIILVSAGSGSAVTKVIVKALKDSLKIPSIEAYYNVAIVSTAVVLTLLSQSIVGLVVSFYATYVGAILIPFGIVILEKKNFITIKNHYFLNMIVLSFALSLLIFFLQKSQVFSSADISLYMLFAGCLGSLGILATIPLTEKITQYKKILKKEEHS